ncbi:hypothetical protein [Burkholderia ambifaria]|uniref:hypothetical protein n=1 Tax=Burkholderia ambifaria TaxID=152480 RepID=UPI000F806DAA|nr:hypothetical protein [Burkholderia ambifaria]
MATVVNTRLPKLCHARPGQIIRLPDRETGEVLPELFVLVAIDLDKPSRRKRAPFGASAGLYNEERELLLISLTSGRARKLPHLSDRADLTQLKLEDVLPDSADAPVMVSTLEALQVRVTLATVTGRLQRHLNLGRPAEVMDLLQTLAVSADHVTEVKTVQQLNQDEAKRRWREAVHAGETLDSFETYLARN